MKIKSITINHFRHLNNISFNLGKHMTVIAGSNGTGKTSILGLIGHVFKYDTDKKTLLGNRFETKFSDVFRFSRTHDHNKSYNYQVTFENDSRKTAEMRTVTERGKIRYRIDVGGRQRHGGKIKYPVIFLSLKRLIPLAQEDEKKIQIGASELSDAHKTLYKALYNRVFAGTEEIIPVHTTSSNKNSFAPTSDRFDSHGISAGQDNIGQIILALLSFRNLKEINDNYNGGILLLDEIDATLYPASQKNLLRVLLQQAQELNIQVIFTTHSSDILNFLASREASGFKNSTSFVSISNSRGRVEANAGIDKLNLLLAELNHQAIRTIKPKKIKFYFEDAEGYLFYKNIIDDVDFGCEKVYKSLSLSSGTYKTLIDKGFEEFFKCIIVLDGDYKTTFPPDAENNVVFLPGDFRPENVVRDFLASLPDNDPFWENEYQYTKRVFQQSLDGVIDNRDSMKRWFNSQIEYWGVECHSLFSRWKEINPNEVREVIGRTRLIVNNIMENFYELSTN